MTFTQCWNFLKQLFNHWSDDRIASKAAALAYYTLFSLAPLLLISISIMGSVFGEDAAQGQIMRQLSGFVGKEPALQIQEIIQNANKPHTALISSFISIVILFFSASGVFSEIQSGLNEIWGVKTNPDESWFYQVKSRFLSFVMVLGTAFLLLMSLISTTCLTLVSVYFPHFMGADVVMDLLLSHLLSFFIITLLCAMIFKILPDIVLSWKDVWYGAFITSLLFSLGKIFMEYYINNFYVISLFGAAGSLIVILIWMFYTAQILFIGAEITKMISVKKGNPITLTRNAIIHKKLGE